MRQHVGQRMRLVSLLGRDSALAEIASLLATTPLLTLTGPGGVGKTCLAYKVATETASEYPDGVWVIELAAFHENGALTEMVAATLGAPNTPCQVAEERLIEFLRERKTLLVFDNCEHILSDCVALLELLIRMCPQLTVLATSREALRSSFEIAWPVPALAIPAHQSTYTVEEAQDFSAIQLFVRRAKSVMPSFTLTDENATAIATICRFVDGLPLALELAASWITALSLESIAQRLTLGLDILRGGYRTAPERHQSLEATLEWSYRLLSPKEQALFRHLSVLGGSFALDAAVAVSDSPPDEVLAHLRRLLDMSMIAVTEHHSEARYRVPEMLRHYGRQQLFHADEEDEACRRYCAWVTALVQDGCTSAKSTREHVSWLDVCERELSHLRAVLGGTLSRERHGDTLLLAALLTPFWRQRGHIDEGRHWLESALDANASTLEHASRIRARAHNELGVLLMWQGEYEQANAHHRTACDVFEALEDPRGIARTLFQLGFLSNRRGDYAEAKRYLERCLQLYCAMNDSTGMDMTRNRLGIVAWNQGDYELAAAALEESLQYQQTLNDPLRCASTLLNLGILRLEHGRLEQASAFLQECLSLNQALGDRLALTYTYTYLGLLALRQSNLGLSSTLFGQTLTLIDTDSDPQIVTRLLIGIAMLARYREVSYQAALLWGAVDSLRTRYGLLFRIVEDLQKEREANSLREQLGASDFDLALHMGAAMPLSEALVQGRMFLQSLDYSLVNLRGGTRRPPAVPGHNRNAPAERAITSDPDVPGVRLAIYALGQVEVCRGVQLLTSTELTYSKSRELLYYLLTHGPCTKEQICLALWPDATPEYLRSTFRVVLYHLRRALGHERWITRDQQYYAFNRDLPHWFDVTAYETSISEASRYLALAPEQAIAALETAKMLYRGDFWEGLTTSDWMVREQARLRGKLSDALETLAELYFGQQATVLALQTFLQAAERDQFCERAHRGVIRCYLRLSEPGKAALYLAQLQQTFDQHLGFSPAHETMALLEQSERSIYNMA